jgi:phosphate transport system substrate-binding protein
MAMLRGSSTPTLRGATAAAVALALTFGPIAGCRPNAPQRTEANTVLGVGGSFPAPLYTRWAQDYRAVTGITVNYQGVGSVGGLQQKQAKKADFGASDQPLTPAQLKAAGLYQFPVVVGGVTPVVNLPGVSPGQLRLTGPLLGDIYLGAVTRWNDPRIAALNPSLKLPADPIVVAHRATGSGTTFLFTSYLSRVSPAWKAKVGAGVVVAWPVGTAGRGNGGVIDVVQQTSGAIGYVEYTYAKQAGLAFVQLQNRDGAFVAPNAATFKEAMAGADWTKSVGNDLLLLDEPGVRSWPITGATFVILFKQSPKPPKTKQVLAFFDWAFKNGDAAAASLDYVPLPGPVKDLVRKQWATTIKDATGQAIYAPAS